ncbi:MAG TPA: ATP:cob(I)alamin adenosyltransferase, partial [Thermoanaerobaculia bacterium]|nr:ATP:cob(I)alamin adenosyltransferase [Thermoanaerobaculia bacterium]
MAIRINRVYTRGGDLGETSLASGQRVPKDSLRIESFGTVDELNAVMGLVREANKREE